MVHEGPSFPAEGSSAPNTRERGESPSGQAVSGFGWGKLWILLAYAFGGLEFVYGLTGFAMGLLIGFDDMRAVSVFTGVLCFLAGVLLVVGAYGVHRRKRFGLYLALTVSVLQALTGLSSVFFSESSGKAVGLVTIALGGLWFAYFLRRTSFFT